MAVAEATATSWFSRLYDHNMFTIDQSESHFAYSARKCRYHAYGESRRSRHAHARQIKASFSLPFDHSRDRLVVRTLRCGRNNPGSNPGLGIFFFLFQEFIFFLSSAPLTTIIDCKPSCYNHSCHSHAVRMCMSL